MSHPTGYSEQNDDETFSFDWSFMPDSTPVHSPPDDYDSPMFTTPPTQVFDPPPRMISQPHWGTMALGRRMMLQFTVSEQIEPVCVECMDSVLLGRSCEAEMAVCLDLNPYGGYWHGVSRQHALIVRDDSLLKLVDLESTNGTYLNGDRIPPHQPRILRDGDEIMLSRLVMTIHFS